MIGKVITGKSFAGCIRYNLQRAEANILDCQGIRNHKIESIIYDFNLQRKMNPELNNAVGHIILSWSAHDKQKLDAEMMTDCAKEYLKQMGITNTQYLIVQHTDREHPHLHIIYNRVNNEAKTISDKFQKRRNVQVCKKITQEHGFYMAPGKTAVKQHRLKGADKIKYELYEAITSAVKYAKSWQDLESILRKSSIGIHYKYRSGTDEVQGISFSKGAIKLKGSEIDRSLSFGKLNKTIEANGVALPYHASVQQNVPKDQFPKKPGVDIGSALANIGNILTEPTTNPDEAEDYHFKRKHKKWRL